METGEGVIFSGDKSYIVLTYKADQFEPGLKGLGKEKLKVEVSSKVLLKYKNTEREIQINKTLTISSDYEPGTIIASEEKILVDFDNTDIKNCLTKYATSKLTLSDAQDRLTGLNDDIVKKKEAFEELKGNIKKIEDEKKKLNKAFYKRFSRFIQEGTWISEEYYDDEKYYYDA